MQTKRPLNSDDPSSLKLRLTSGIAKTIGVCMLAVLAFCALNSHRAYAYDVNGQLPTDVQDGLVFYDNNPQANLYSLSEWISPAGVPNQDVSQPGFVLNVNQGTPSVGLQLNRLIYLYHSLVNGGPIFPTDGSPNAQAQSESLESSEHITSIGPQGGGCVTSDNYNGSGPNPCDPANGGGYPSGQTQTAGLTQGTRYWGSGINTPIGFYYIPPSNGFSNSGAQTVTILLTFSQINTWPNNPPSSRYQCTSVGTGNYVNGPNDWGDCPTTTIPFTIQINVQPTTVTVSGLVYKWNGSGSAGIGGISIYTCDGNVGFGGFVGSNPDGSYSFTVPVGTGFCVRATDPSNPSATWTITPEYIFGQAGRPPNGSPPPGVNGSCGGNSTSYEEQQANNPTSPGGCNYGMSSDGNYDIAEMEVPIAPTCSSSSYTNTPGTVSAPTGEPATFAWDDYYWNGTGYSVAPQSSGTDINGNPVDDPISNLVTAYTFDDGTTGTVPVLNSNGSSGYAVVHNYNFGQYEGFQNVRFSSTATYSPNTATEPQRWFGGPNANDFTVTRQENIRVTANPPANQNPVPTPNTLPPCVQSVQCVPTNNLGTFGTGRQASVSLEETYTVAQYGSPPAAPGDQYMITINPAVNLTNGSGGSLGGPRDEIRYSTTSPSQGSGTITFSPSFYASSPNSFNATWQLTGSGVPGVAACQSSFNAANQPYVQVNGGDVVVGSKFGGTDCTESGANISAWNNNDGAANSGYNNGAGSEFAVEAVGPVNGFVSAQNLPNGSSSPPKTLSFANTSGTFGGSFGIAPCGNDYYSHSTSANKLTSAPSSISSFSSSGSGAYYYNANGGTITFNGGNIGMGKQYTLYVAGNVYISRDITYANGAARITDIPDFKLVVSGNIYIDPSVSTLEGEYIAQNGTISTCSGSTGSFSGNSACNSPLTVNGAFASNTIKYWRTYGTMGTLGSVPHAPAETFNYSPYVWLAPPTITSSSAGWDAITSLPPVL